MAIADIPLIGAQETIELIKSGEVKSLNNIHNVEAALVFIKQAEDKIEQFKEIKRKRNELIDNEMNNLTKRNEFLKSVIIETLKDTGQKAVNFPGVGKVSKRPKKGKWIVKDEENLIKILKAAGEEKNTVESKDVIKKGELNKLLDIWQSIGKVPTSCVEKELDTDTVAITFEEEKDSQADTIPSLPKKYSDEIDLDELNFVGSKV
jgi:hypothetical protein